MGVVNISLLSDEAIVAPFAGEREKYEGDNSIYRSLIQSISEYVYSVQMRDGTVESLYHSPQSERLSGYTPLEHYTNPQLWHAMIHEDDRDRVTDYFTALGEEGEKGLIEYRIVCKDNSIRWVANSCVVSHEENGELLRLDGFLLDITERKRIKDELVQAKERAEAATRLKDNFVSMVAHDLRSPFAGILGLLQLVANDQKASLHVRHKELLDRVIASCQVQLEMINELLNITRISTGKLTPRRRFVPVERLIETAIENQRYQAEKKGVRLERGKGGFFSLYVDQALIVEALNNLINNAIKFTPKGGAVRLVVSVANTITISVIDQGRGVNKDFVEHLFRHDVRTTSVGTAGEMGTGLGLPYSAEIMKAHNGSLSYSPAPEGGSVFTLTLPCVKPEALVVDDDPVALASVRTLLEREGYFVQVANGGEAAIRLLEKRPPHLLITDLMMGGVDGYGLIRYLRSTPSLASIPVMVLTVKQTRDRALFDLGIDDFVMKPIDPAELAPRVQRFLG